MKGCSLIVCRGIFFLGVKSLLNTWMIYPKLFLDDKEDSLYTLFTQHWYEICLILFTR